MGTKYTIGIDYGTLSARALLVDVNTGEEIETALYEYPHGVMDTFLPDHKTRLMPDFALQHPQDYIDALQFTVTELLKKTGISKEDVIGICSDFTECSMLPVDEKGIPLCFQERYKTNPHSYVKLWKHHAAQDEASQLNQIAEMRGEAFLKRYGGKISSEWMFPKIWQILDEDPELYHDTAKFMELADWATMQLTGVERKNSCTAGYKAIWHKREGFPSKAFFKALHPALENVIDEKFNPVVIPIGSAAGQITKEAAALTGLKEGTIVAVGIGDAHAAVPAVGITEPGKMLMIMGTSTCHMMLGEKEAMVPGMCGVVEDGIIPGYYGYEAGQSCVGDHFQWFKDHCVPEAYEKEAKERGIHIFALLSEKAEKLRPGQSGLLALDWWNGNRSVLVDVDLTGLIIGMTLLTRPEEIYRALIEATAFGTKMIVETFREYGVPVNELYAAGGIAEKNQLMMQIYADVTNMDIKIAASPQAPALGAAIYAAVAAGKERGGYDDIYTAANVMGKVKDLYYTPNKESVSVYQSLYEEYKKLHDYFGRGENTVMKRLKKIKENVYYVNER
ncbi:MAG: ribulokinase [Eubacteriales bacterium]|nr:ribulokinase [Eubacteriales bacterium]